MEDTLSKFMSESSKRHEENSNLIKEIRASMDAVVRNQRASIKTLEIQIEQVSKVLQERGFGSLPNSTEAYPRDQVKLISTTIEVDSYPIRRIGSTQYADPLDRTDKMEYEGNNVLETLLNVSIFVGTFSVVTDFAVLENMDAYRDEGMGDIIVGEPFLKEVGIKARWFEGTITLYKDGKSVSDDDIKNRISHSYQKLKGFYKEVLNLGPNYIRDARMKECLTRGDISVHEME
nr:hypothetical protein [Tanacetum cinerariifolium]